MKFSDEQRKFIILQFEKRLSAFAVERKLLETYAIWVKQGSKFILTDFQREWQQFQDKPLPPHAQKPRMPPCETPARY